ncbi:MAG: hypothetical protein JWN67_420 [Actinomycetia bacterium]|nr:hypothetical protein [Actinomycetes bacterium]
MVGVEVAWIAGGVAIAFCACVTVVLLAIDNGLFGLYGTLMLMLAAAGVVLMALTLIVR